MQLSVREAAKFLNVTEKALYRWISKREIPLYQVNGQYRFSRAELLEWATARNIAVSTSVLRPDHVTGPLPSVSRALEEGGVHHRLPGSDKASVLRAMIDALRLPEKLDRNTLYEILVARESSGTTALGNGIAIPHVRNPIVLPVGTCSMALFFLETPVDFRAADGKPVHTLFWLVSPTIPAHMHLLSRLASAIRDPGVQAVLSRQAAADEVLAEVRRAEAGADGGGAR